MDKLSVFLAKSGMRKVGSGLYMFTLSAALAWFHAVSGAEFVEFSKILVMSLFAGNAAEHFAKRTDKPEGNSDAA
jgi:hypothetical protein